MPRKYAPIWNNLKATGSCVITAPKGLHARIVKAVIKEKHNDVGYALLLSEEGKIARLYTSYDHAIVKFILKKTLRLDNL